MHVLSIMPVADIVLAGPNRVQPGLFQSQLPNFVEEWQRPGKRTTWQQFFRSLPSKYQDKARQDYQRHRSEAARPAADPVADDPVADVPNPGGPMGEQTEFGFQQGPNPKEFVELLRGKIREFGTNFNVQTIRPYNSAIQQAMQAVKNLATMPQLSPEVEQVGNQLMQLFQDIAAGDAEDVKLVNQLGGLAQQLAASSTSSALTQDSPGAFSPGWHQREPATEPATPVSRAAPRSNRPAFDKMQPQQNWWQRMTGQPATT